MTSDASVAGCWKAHGDLVASRSNVPQVLQSPDARQLRELVAVNVERLQVGQLCDLSGQRGQLVSSNVEQLQPVGVGKLHLGQLVALREERLDVVGQGHSALKLQTHTHCRVVCAVPEQTGQRYLEGFAVLTVPDEQGLYACGGGY